MSLIIAARCSEGAIAIADTRSHIKRDGRVAFDDNYEKTRIVAGYLVCNHGYNRINDSDWKESRIELRPDAALRIYSDVAQEMVQKADKFAGYLFLNKSKFYEIEIEAGRHPKGAFRNNHDRMAFGSGAKYVNLNRLCDLKHKRLREVRPLLQAMFEEAYKLQLDDGQNYFCANSTVVTLKG